MTAFPFTEGFRSLARTVRHLPDRVLHHLRRLIARSSLRRASAPSSILILCHGNICRSPYAEHALRIALPPILRARVRAESTGFVGPGRTPPEEALAVAGARGVDLSAHVSRLIEVGRLSDHDLVLVMDPAQRRTVMNYLTGSRPLVIVLGDLDPCPIETRAIRDPIDQTREVFEACYDRIDRCVAELVRISTWTRPATGR